MPDTMAIVLRHTSTAPSFHGAPKYRRSLSPDLLIGPGRGVASAGLAAHSRDYEDVALPRAAAMKPKAAIRLASNGIRDRQG